MSDMIFPAQHLTLIAMTLRMHFKTALNDNTITNKLKLIFNNYNIIHDFDFDN